MPALYSLACNARRECGTRAHRLTLAGATLRLPTGFDSMELRSTGQSWPP